MTSNAMRCPCGTLDLPLEVTSSFSRISGHMIFAQNVGHRCSEALHMPYEVHVPTFYPGNTSKVADLLDTSRLNCSQPPSATALCAFATEYSQASFFVGLVTFLYPINPVMTPIAVCLLSIVMLVYAVLTLLPFSSPTALKLELAPPTNL
ncbi:hypothetical protein DFH07DRAFT_1030265 [Mycena maculata]|uniref:Uncharacterized protein n=1 Tax=Mycena maculata TaxID=230809 RepID=A0AAD7NXN1_9AGAR|nr:hypothetical protein DFH07DRAFT_1030265 [Mycena maculata]